MRQKTPQFLRILVLLTVPAILALSALLWFLLPRTVGDHFEHAQRTDPHRQVIEETLARTLRESQSGVAEYKIQAPPTVWRDATAFSEASRQSHPTPPEGYDFVTHTGSMKRAPLPTRAPAQPTPNPAWLDPSIAVDQLRRQAEKANRDWTFAIARLATATSISERQLTQSLAPLGAKLEGLSGEYARIRVPARTRSLQSIESLPQILALGAMPVGLKTLPGFVEQANAGTPSEFIPVFITLMANDPAGQWRLPLAELGVITGDYDADLRTYTANMPMGALNSLVQADFVMAVEPVSIVRAAHDTSVPATGVDALREYQSANSLFTGTTGEGIPVGVIDTGLNIRHLDISSGRDSICGANFEGLDDWDLWIDTSGHGTHVTGTLVGAGRDKPLFAGVAPNASHIRIAKALNDSDYGTSATVRRSMDFLAVPSGCVWNGQATAEVKPLIVNLSLEEKGSSFAAASILERKLDSIVYSYGQLYVAAQPQAGEFLPSNYATAKNSLAVGAVDDSGIIARTSGPGPTPDHRLVPNLVGVGMNVMSTAGRAVPSGYVRRSGTSMAAPSVSGVAALLMEAESGFRDQPALTRARLMASAIRPDAFLEGPDHFPRSNTKGPGLLQNRYGLGLVSGRATVLSRDTEEGWVLGSATSEPTNGSYEYVDLEVPEGASRLDIVMTWDEQPSDTLSKTVLNNLDLWVDAGADCTEEPCGEYSSLSTRDNVEWLFIDDPEPGTHRIKVAPKSLFGEAVKAAIAWTIVRGEATPQLKVTVENSSITSSVGEPFEVELTVSSDQYIASGVTLYADCESDSGTRCSLDSTLQHEQSYVVREDGLTRDLTGGGLYAVSLGEIAVDDERRVRLKFLPRFKHRAHRLYFTASAWNATADTAGLLVLPDEMSRVTSSDGSNGDSTTLSEDRSPENDDFADASTIQGENGSNTVELFAASREPGEAYVERNSRTIWFSWTAPDDGLFRFRLANAESGAAFTADMHLYTGDTLVSLVRSANKDGSELSFDAQQGVVYSLQVESTSRNTQPLTLKWERADVRPANDDFAFAQELPSEAGSVEGSNEGATLERSEFWGGRAATVWYKWTAPSDSHWRFRLRGGSAYLMVFHGDALQNLRLASHPRSRSQAAFPAATGETYYIAAAAHSADESGTQFELIWESIQGVGPSVRLAHNDQFENAETIYGAEGKSAVDWTLERTVQPGEPHETGVGTVWWKWTAPDTDTYTWQFGGPPELLYSLYTGGKVDELTLVAHGRLGTSFKIDAQANITYFIALGQSRNSINEFLSGAETFSWGKAPFNDDRGTATELAGASGSAVGNLKFATIEPEEPIDTLGYESIWWTWSAPSSGWHRFWVEDNPLSAIISIYPADGVGGAHAAPVASSDRSFMASGRVQAHLLVRAGMRYDIRLSQRPGEDLVGPLSLRWESLRNAPTFLAYSGAVTNESLESAEFPSPLSYVKSIAISADGSRLFATSENRLLMFARDSSDGSLSILDRYDWDADASPELGPDHLNTAHLRWDTAYNRLIAVARSRDVAFAFTLSPDQNRLEYGGEITVDGDSRYSGVRPPGSIVADSAGRFVYAVEEDPAVVRVLRVDSANEWTLVQTIRKETANSDDELVVPSLRSPRDLAVSSDDSHLYLAAEEALLVFSQDAATGKLSLSTSITADESSDPDLHRILGFLSWVDLDESGKYLFAATGSAHVAVFDVSTDPANPRLLDKLNGFYIAQAEREVELANYLFSPIDVNWCGWGVRHGLRYAVDFACRQGYHVVRWDAESETLLVTDWGQAGHVDRFGGTPPQLPQMQSVQPVQSPDGKHLYAFDYPYEPYRASRGRDAIHIFQRASAMTLDPGGNHAPPVTRLLTDQTAMVGEAFSYQFAADTFTDPDGDSLAYSASGMPAWLSFAPATRSFSGTPAAADVTPRPILITVTAMDPGGANNSTRFALTVLADPVAEDTSPEFSSTGRPVDQTYTLGTVIDALTLPAATGGDGTLSYGLTPSVPGLAFDAATRQLTGTPTAAGTHSMTYTVTDTGGDTDSLSFTITVQTAPPADTSPAFPTTGTPGNQTYTVGTAISTLALPTATGGNGTLTYSLSPAVPGLSFDTTTRQLTGTPTTAGTYAMTYTVTDADGDSDSLSFTITVQPSGGDMETDLGDCRIGLLVHPGQSCTYPGTDDAFSVGADGRGMFLIITSARAININKVTYKGTYYDFRAEHEGDGVWRVDRLDGSTTP